MKNDIPLSVIKNIPYGPYCYDDRGMCRYWSVDPTKPPQENGYCVLLGRGDWTDDGVNLLWDQVKECDIRHDDR